MKKFIIICLLLIHTLFLVSCSCGKSKAERIYNNKNLSTEEKINQLATLWAKEIRSEDSYNDNLSDRAWDAISSGNFDKAYAITQGFKSGAGGDALYYIFLLQKELPQPDAVYLKIYQKSYNKNYYAFDVEVDFTDVAHRLAFEESFFNIKISIKDGPYYNEKEIDIYEMEEVKFLDFTHINLDSNYYEIELHITVNAPSYIDYWKPSKEYVYKLTIEDVTKITTQKFKMEYYGIYED